MFHPAINGPPQARLKKLSMWNQQHSFSSHPPSFFFKWFRWIFFVEEIRRFSSAQGLLPFHLTNNMIFWLLSRLL